MSRASPSTPRLWSTLIFSVTSFNVSCISIHSSSLVDSDIFQWHLSMSRASTSTPRLWSTPIFSVASFNVSCISIHSSSLVDSDMFSDFLQCLVHLHPLLVFGRLRCFQWLLSISCAPPSTPRLWSTPIFSVASFNVSCISIHSSSLVDSDIFTDFLQCLVHLHPLLVFGRLRCFQWLLSISCAPPSTPRLWSTPIFSMDSCNVSCISIHSSSLVDSDVFSGFFQFLVHLHPLLVFGRLRFFQWLLSMSRASQSTPLLWSTPILSVASFNVSCISPSNPLLWSTPIFFSGFFQCLVHLHPLLFFGRLRYSQWLLSMSRASPSTPLLWSTPIFSVASFNVSCISIHSSSLVDSDIFSGFFQCLVYTPLLWSAPIFSVDAFNVSCISIHSSTLVVSDIFSGFFQYLVHLNPLFFFGRLRYFSVASCNDSCISIHSSSLVDSDIFSGFFQCLVHLHPLLFFGRLRYYQWLLSMARAPPSTSRLWSTPIFTVASFNVSCTSIHSSSLVDSDNFSGFFQCLVHLHPLLFFGRLRYFSVTSFNVSCISIHSSSLVDSDNFSGFFQCLVHLHPLLFFGRLRNFSVTSFNVSCNSIHSSSLIDKTR